MTNIIRKEILKTSYIKDTLMEIDFEYKVRYLITEKRLKMGMTQVELAEKLRTTQSAISRYESGRLNPTIHFVQTVLEILELRIRIDPY